MAFRNGVFHHNLHDERSAAVNCVYRSLRFDRGAITLIPSETRRLLRAGGFKILRTDFLLIMPRELR